MKELLSKYEGIVIFSGECKIETSERMEDFRVRRHWRYANYYID
jgi:hypothetical protein